MDEHEFAEAFRRHHDRLGRLAYVLCGDSRRAEDAVAEAFAKVWPKYRAGRVDDLGAYLKRAVVNEIRGGFRRRVVERREEERRRHEWTEGVPSHGQQVADRMSLAEALWCLPMANREVLVLRFYEDLSEAEIAEALGIAPGTVKSRSARGLAMLRELMPSEAVDG